MNIFLFLILVKDNQWIFNFNWLDSIRNNVNIKEKIIYLVGNKIDVENRSITKEEAKDYAKEINLRYYEVSCKLNYGIKETIDRMFNDLVNLDIKINEAK